MLRVAFNFACFIATALVTPTSVLAEKSEAVEDVFLTAVAEAFLLTNYKHYQDHKAFVIGPGGFWTYTVNKSTEEHAVRQALENCQRIIRNTRPKSLWNRPCVPYHINDKKVFTGTDHTYPIGRVLSEPDLPLQRAIYDKKPAGETKAILLMLHGCNRLTRSVFNPREIWGRWVKQFHSLGMHVIVPDSFADRRPGERCAPHRPEWLRSREFVTRYRTAQAKRTLGILKKKFPGLPIFIWGHSGGGMVAQLLDDKVAGIIITGNACGLTTRGLPLTDKNVPLLVFIGTKDTIIPNPDGQILFNIAKVCLKILRVPKWSYIVLPGVGHHPSMRSQAVRDPLRSFILLGIEASRRGTGD